MSTDTRPGGFVGDPAEAFTPPAASGCCGGTPATDSASSSGCCGSAEATAAGQCCTPAARQEAVDAGAGCCG
ncbi:MAG: hypothetical protein M3422_02200 [Actinomycetota bacterium]|nr:hypothetical protein [Actinomycetota bacterium]